MKSNRAGPGNTAGEQRTVTISVPLYPTPQAAQKLLHGMHVAEEIRSAVAGYLQQRAAGGTERLLDVALHQAPLRAGGPARVQRITQTQLQEARDVLGWGSTLPTSTINLIGLDALAASLLPPGVKSKSQDVLPRLDLDGGLWALDKFRVSVHALGEDAVQWADIFALPTAYGAALRSRQDRHLHGEQRRLLQAQQRFVAGDQDALAECIRIGGRLQSGDLEERPGAPCGEEPDQPRALERSVIRQVRRPGGEIGWEIGMKFSVAANFSRSPIPDTVGIDIGADLPLAWASGSETGSFSQRLLQLPVPAAPAPSIAQAPRPYDEHLGRAWGRRLILDALRPGYEAALAQILRYERIAVEAIDWTTFRHGFKFAEFAEHAHLHTVLGWLEALAPLHGSRIVRVDPHFTSRTCSRCGWVNKRRPRRGEPFICERPSCAHVQVSHLNAALVTRSRAGVTRAGQ